MPRVCVVLAVAGALFGALHVAAQEPVGDLVVRVVGLPSEFGAVRYGVYDNEAAFDTRSTRIPFKGACRISGDRCEFIIQKAPFGHYAVMVYHDENSNEEYDWGLFDRERSGVSNYAARLWSSPDFHKAKFSHDRERTVVEVRVY
jgi:uncharacterized protein (DUF2141 family)